MLHSLLENFIFTSDSPCEALTAARASFMTSTFFLGTSPSSNIFSLSSTCSLSFSPKIVFGVSEKASILDAIEHLLAKNREIRPLFLAVARPINVEWNSRPYLGVFPFVFRARKRAFSAPRIWTVDAGYFANFVSEPAWLNMNLIAILDTKYFHNSIYNGII